MSFKRAAETHGDQADRTVMLLCLADMHGQDTLHLLIETVRSAGRWSFHPDQSDHLVMTARNENGDEIQLMQGHQVVSAEGLELLGLGCALELEERSLPVSAMIKRVLDAGGLPVLPWAFGKWAGSRGGIVASLIDARRDFLLGDNGNRPKGFPLPRLLLKGEKRGFGVLAGSDPLPLDKQDQRPGSVGIICRFEGSATGLRSASFKSALLHGKNQSRYGHYPSLANFGKCMLQMQLRKIIPGPIGDHS